MRTQLALLAALAFLTVPAVAAAQEPVPDERAAAQAFADAAKRLDAVREPGDFCAELRAWRRAGYPHRSALRSARADVESMVRLMTPGIVRRLAAAAARMMELGVSKDDAQAFGPSESTPAGAQRRAAS